MNLVQGNPLGILQSVSESTAYWNYRIHSTYSGCDRCAAHSTSPPPPKKKPSLSDGYWYFEKHF